MHIDFSLWVLLLVEIQRCRVAESLDDVCIDALLVPAVFLVWVLDANLYCPIANTARALRDLYKYSPHTSSWLIPRRYEEFYPFPMRHSVSETTASPTAGVGGTSRGMDLFLGVTGSAVTRSGCVKSDGLARRNNLGFEESV